MKTPNQLDIYLCIHTHTHAGIRLFCVQLFAGVDEDGPSLYYLDYMGSLQEVNFTAHGYAAYFCLSLLDRQYKGDLTQEDGVKLMKEVIGQLRTRFIMHMPTFMLKTITADGITEQLI
jgi:20S proteasome subunit beta 4